jgi:hypothetical protein
MWCLDLESLKNFKDKFVNKNISGAIVFSENNSAYYGLTYGADLNFGWELVTTKPKN